MPLIFFGHNQTLDMLNVGIFIFIWEDIMNIFRFSVIVVIFFLMNCLPVVQANPNFEREICFTSYNSRGKSFFLHILFDRNNNPRTIRYKGNPVAITLAYYGRERIYLPDLRETRSATVYMETYRNSVTGKLYILDTPLYNGIYVAFVRRKDGQFFYFNECM